MQRISYWLKTKNTINSIIRTSQNSSQLLKSACRFTVSSTGSKPHSKTVQATRKFAKTKMLAQVSGIALMSLPAKSITIPFFDTQPDVYDSVISSKTLTLAAVPGDSTYFSTGGFQHGFGYDIARSYANELGVDIVVKNYTTDEEALKAVNLGIADMALTTASTLMTESSGLTALNVSCGFDQTLAKNGLHPKTNWSFRNNKDPLAIKASHFLCDNDQMKNTAKIANFYDQTLLQDDYNLKHFEKALNNRLPNYKSSFKEQASTYDHDWQLLVAMGYQESHLNANAVSPTGVKGLMMLTNSTAKEMGVSDRVDPYQSIGGGARYLEQMKSSFSHIPNPDRLWFALASYNMGPNAVKQVQKKVAAKGQDPNNWSTVYAYMSDNASNNSRYRQCMHYVTNIRSYLETLKTRSA